MDSRTESDYRAVVYATYVSQKTSQAGYGYRDEDYQRWADGAAARLSGWLPPAFDTPILDLGCGPGNLLYLFERLGYTSLTGVDLSAEQLELARAHCSRAWIIEADIHDVLIEHPGYYGLITAFDIIEHFKKDEILPLLKQMAQALRPGGRVILQTPNAESPRVGSVAYGDFTHEWFFTPASLADMLRLVGLTDYQARPSGPQIHGVKSFVRAMVWKSIQAGLTVWELAETGHRGSGVYTRVFTATAIKP